MLPSELNRVPNIEHHPPYSELFRQHRRVIFKPAVKGEFMGSQVSSDEMSVYTGQGNDEVLVSQAVWDYLAAVGRSWLLDIEDKQGLSAGIIRRGECGGCCAVRHLSPVRHLLPVKSPARDCGVSSDEMSVRTGQGSDEVLVSQAVWDYLAAAGRSWLLDFEDKQGLSAGIVRRGERGGCCAVRLSPVEGRTSLTEGPVSAATRKAFIDLCRSARKEMTKQEAAPKRKRSLLPCIGVVEMDAEGSLLPPPPPQPRRSQRQQQQRYKKNTETDPCAAPAKTTDCASGASRSIEDDSVSCSICMGEMVEKTTLDKCGHSFCRSCLEQAFQVKKACPVCRLVYGQLIGNQPANGSMMVERDPDLELPGHEGYGCICIIYSFPPGFQSREHPNPGVLYPGTDRVAYLPDSPEGNRVLRLLRRAFEQRLIFTIGTSMTTGMHNVITWNDIHHKTAILGGSRSFGYPDPTYLVRVTEELREKGITAD